MQVSAQNVVGVAAIDLEKFVRHSGLVEPAGEAAVVFKEAVLPSASELEEPVGGFFRGLPPFQGAPEDVIALACAWSESTDPGETVRVSEGRVSSLIGAYAEAGDGAAVCSMLSRSRRVTVSLRPGSFSPRVSKSMVTPKGVPISSWRR